MTLIASFEVRGRPPVKRRPRFARVGGGVRTFTDERTAAEEEDLRQCARRHAPHEPARCPLRLYVRVRLAVPRSWSQRNQAAALRGEIRPGRPDLDNYTKAVMDALNGLMWRDDSLVAELVAEKRYAEHDGLVVSVCTLTPSAGGTTP
jgi:Holliday junction resolvase RusA-like endonuclease